MRLTGQVGKNLRPTPNPYPQPPSSIVRLAEIHSQRTELAVKVRALHAHALCELADLAVAELQLRGEIGALEMLAGFAQGQRQQVLLDQRLVDRRLRGDLSLDFLETDFLGPTLDQQALARREPVDVPSLQKL